MTNRKSFGESGTPHSTVGAMIALLGFALTMRGLLEESAAFWIGILLFGGGAWLLAHGALLRTTQLDAPATQALRAEPSATE